MSCEQSLEMSCDQLMEIPFDDLECDSDSEYHVSHPSSVETKQRILPKMNTKRTNLNEDHLWERQMNRVSSYSAATCCVESSDGYSTVD